LNAIDDLSGVKEIRYLVDGVPGTIQGDHGTFILTEDGDEILVEYWAIDNAGNIEERHSFTLDIDQEYPDMDFNYIAYDEEDQWYFLFTANCSDVTSGMNRVEFYINDELRKTVFGTGPIYDWIEELNVGYNVNGWICKREITEGNVTFFALIVRIVRAYSLLPSLHGIWAKAYDNASNWDIRVIPGGWRPPSYRYYFRHFTFPNNYEGQIGRFFIDATFWMKIDP
jgi:hypothetical protein